LRICAGIIDGTWKLVFVENDGSEVFVFSVIGLFADGDDSHSHIGDAGASKMGYNKGAWEPEKII